MAIREATSIRARTADVPGPEQFDYFRDVISDVYLGIRTEWTGSGDFVAEFDSVEADGAVLARMRAPGCVGRRDETLVRRRPDSAFYLNLGVGSRHRVDHLGRDWHVASGQPFLLDSERPFIVDFADQREFRLFSLRIEKGAGFEPDAGGVRRIDERIATTAAGRQLAAQARLMCAEIEAGRMAVAAAMSVPVRALLSVLLADTDDHPRRFEEYTTVAGGRIADPAFGISDLADAFAVSARTIQSIFHGEGTTFGAWLLAERLDLAQSRLAAEGWRGRSISEIASSSGFRDASHFHRTYRDRFGSTPGSARSR